MTFIPSDGRLTSQNTLTTLNGLEVMYIVSPGNAQFGNSYQVSTTLLAQFFSSFPESSAEVITAGSTYNVLSTDTRILVNKTIVAPITIVFPAGNSMASGGDILVKDLKGSADNVNSITLDFGANTCDGLSSFAITNPYGWFKVTPVPGSANWYMSG